MRAWMGASPDDLDARPVDRMLDCLRQDGLNLVQRLRRRTFRDDEHAQGFDTLGTDVDLDAADTGQFGDRRL